MRTNLFILFFFPLVIFASNIDSLNNKQINRQEDSILVVKKNKSNSIIKKDSLIISIDPKPIYFKVKNINNWWEKNGLVFATILMAIFTFIGSILTYYSSRKSINAQMEISVKNIYNQRKLANEEKLSRKKDKLIDDIIINYSEYIKTLNFISNKLFKQKKYDSEFKEYFNNIIITKSLIILILQDKEFDSVKYDIIHSIKVLEDFFTELINENVSGEDFLLTDTDNNKRMYNNLIVRLNDSFSKIMTIRDNNENADNKDHG